MRVFGYVKKRHGKQGLVELSEITIQATPDRLREVATFLIESARGMDEHHERFGHSHIQDALKNWRADDPKRMDIIVASPLLGNAQPGAAPSRRPARHVRGRTPRKGGGW